MRSVRHTTTFFQRLGSSLNLQSNFPVTGMITQRDGLTIISTNPPVGIQNKICVTGKSSGIPSHAGTLGKPKEIAAGFGTQHILSQRQFAGRAITTGLKIKYVGHVRIEPLTPPMSNHRAIRQDAILGYDDYAIPNKETLFRIVVMIRFALGRNDAVITNACVFIDDRVLHARVIPNTHGRGILLLMMPYGIIRLVIVRPHDYRPVQFCPIANDTSNANN